MKVLFLIFGLASVAVCQTVITIDGTGSGKIFDGIGAISGGGGDSRLLVDYPSTQRSQVLDLLFKPNYGASLHHLKVEIGADANTSIGAEASHERAQGVINCNRGYEWWLMQQAAARNPSIILSSLMWGTAGWAGMFFSDNNIQYVNDWLTCAVGNGLTIQYTGIWNETAYNIPWIKSLKSGLTGAGFSTKIIAADEVGSTLWGIADDMASDPALASSVDVIGAHYPTSHGGTYPTAAALSSGKKLWTSEDGPWNSSWTGASAIAKLINRNYIQGSITSSIIWNLITSFYPGMPYPNSGLMTADSPWSGSFSADPAIWAVAHTTQFAQPGWQYLDAASGLLSSGSTGSYVALKSGSNYSLVIETLDASTSQSFTFTVTGGLSTGTVHVWQSTSSSQFVQQADITPSVGVFSFTAAPHSIYSLTTTTGQAKGAPAPPAAWPFPFPYSETFESYSVGALAKYFADLVGGFEVQNCTGRIGKCLQQAVTTEPILWPQEHSIWPLSYVGSTAWTDYQVSVDAQLLQSGSVVVAGRATGYTEATGQTPSYQFRVSDAGAWTLTKAQTGGTLASGSLGSFGLNTWHNLKLAFSGGTITAAVDGTQIASVTDSTYASGQAAIGTGSFIGAQFDNFQVCPVGGCPTALSTTTNIGLSGNVGISVN